MATCDLCGGAAAGAATRRLYSAEREEKLKDAVWSTSRVTLHLSDFREHDVAVCGACRRAAWRWYLGPFLPGVIALALWGVWLAVQPHVAPQAAPEYIALPALVGVVLILRAPLVVRRRYGLGERGFGETPLCFFSLHSYIIRRLTDQHPERVYWTPRWYRYYRERFQ